MRRLIVTIAFVVLPVFGSRVKIASDELKEIGARTGHIPLTDLASMLLSLSPAIAQNPTSNWVRSRGSDFPSIIMHAGGERSSRDSGQWSRRELAAAAIALPFVGQGQAQAASSKGVPYAKQPGIKLNTGTIFPYASFGLQIYDDKTAEKLTLLALQAGYRNFFASVLAGNQKGFARAIKKSGIPRDEIFICGSVLSNRAVGFDAAYKASARQCKENMDAFNEGDIFYIDMIMLDYPGPDDESIRGQWRALEEMQESGLTRSIAVSNFSPRQLDVILANKSAIKPAVNQLPYGVGYNRDYQGKVEDTIKENRDRGIVVQAWSPLRNLKRKADLTDISTKYSKSEAQVALRYIVDTGATFTTQTKSLSHFVEDIDIFDFELTKEEIRKLS